MAYLRDSVACAAAVLALASCTSDAEEPTDPGRVVQLGAPGETGRELTPEEIARMAGGQTIGEATRRHARELLRAASPPARSRPEKPKP